MFQRGGWPVCNGKACAEKFDAWKRHDAYSWGCPYPVRRKVRPRRVTLYSFQNSANEVPCYLMPRFPRPLHSPELRAFGNMPAMLHLKSEILIKRDIVLVCGFEIRW